MAFLNWSVGNEETVKIALNEWPATGAWIAGLHVSDPANAPCPMASGSTQTRTFARPSPLTNYCRLVVGRTKHPNPITTVRQLGGPRHPERSR